MNAGPRRIEFSLVSAVYNVARYLDDFIASVEAQTFDLSAVEVIMVDDGSTDETSQMLKAWEVRRPDLVTVLTKENGGQASARNLGIEQARGRWVSFPDPDDVLAPDYLERVARFIAAEPDVDLVGCARWVLDDASGRLTDTHPLRHHFAGGDRLRDLEENPQHFYGSAPVAFFRRQRLDDLGLRFDAELRPNFEDGALCVRYLLGSPGRPRVGFVGSAHYHYRRRNDATSTLQTSLAHPGRYTDVLRDGYLAVLQEAVDERGVPPEWLQNHILYELSWFFSSQDGASSRGSAETAGVADEYHRLLGHIRRLLEDDVIEAFTVRPMKRIWKDILLHSYADAPWCTPYVRVDRTDADQGLTRLVYHYTGDAPAERVLVNGVEMSPRHAKVRDIAYHGRVVMRERVLWVTSRANVRIVLDGRRLPFRFDQPSSAITWLKPGRVRSEIAARETTHPMDVPSKARGVSAGGAGGVAEQPAPGRHTNNHNE
ncbi:glycosyltransferase [Mumia sp.]|uniref:glycosyltransferase family 2 protein n=1 Tax=Mumia sp. TaxID=1965300 RepID=UPI002601A00A|nr:glycosyltransferase [Mumia sp.]MDD9350578.1 glycosyltransferase [Mumia sp.]